MKSVEDSEYYNMVESLWSVPRISNVAGTRTRTEFLFTDTRSGVPMLYLWDKGECLPVLPDNNPVTGLCALHHVNPWVVFGRDEKGNEDFTVYVVDYETHEMDRATEEGIGRLTELFWVSDDEWLVIGCNDQEYFISLLQRDGTRSNLYTTDAQIMVADYDDSRELVVAAVGRGPGSRIALMNIRKRNIVWISESDTSEDTFPRIFPEKGYYAYVTDVKGESEIVVRRVDTQEVVSRVFFRGDIQVLPGRGILEWLDKTTLFVAPGIDAELSPRLLDIEKKVCSDPLTKMSVIGSTQGGEGVVWVGSSLSDPPAIQFFKKGRATALVRSHASGYSSGESHWYHSFDDNLVQGWLVKSKKEKAPLVVYCHGGPNFATLNIWDPELQALVKAGYHVFAPNFRGSTTFGSAFKNRNIGDIGGGDIKDVLYGAKYARELLGVEGNPAIAGGSYGGYLTLQALATQPEKWAGGVALVPWVDLLETYEMVDAHYRALMIYLLGGTPEEKRDLYRERSPINHIEKLKRPVLILAGENDSRCPLELIQKFHERATQLHLPVELKVLEEEGHIGSHLSSLVRISVFELEFLKTLFFHD
ncbi:MAG: S9 family peptidase [Theionarchaea archaeon]|nr:S9 family peptidase [Theionarchaea archaeon]MBU7020277.1 S9 family peptidase [Theionarchaea archaeon]MBU7041495.1 S9 family peptidase [Theionarchaea archaeon]